jgi:hypothetical protein
LVGVAGTTASWLSAREDRAAQRELARDQRTYDRRAAVYLDAIQLLQRQDDTWSEYLKDETHFQLLPERQSIPWQARPPRALDARLRAFGSARAFDVFETAEQLQEHLTSYRWRCVGARACRRDGEKFLVALGEFVDPPPGSYKHLKVFRSEINR